MQSTLHRREELLDGDGGVPENPAKRTEGDFWMKGNGDGEPPGIGGVTKTDVAALLPYGNVSELS